MMDLAGLAKPSCMSCCQQMSAVKDKRRWLLRLLACKASNWLLLCYLPGWWQDGTLTIWNPNSCNIKRKLQVSNSAVSLVNDGTHTEVTCALTQDNSRWAAIKPMTCLATKSLLLFLLLLLLLLNTVVLSVRLAAILCKI